MKQKTITIGTLLNAGLIKKTSKVKVTTSNLSNLHLIKPIPKKKLISILELRKSGMIKK